LRLLVRATCGQCNHIEFRDNALGKKEAPTPFRGNVGAEVCARWPYGGRCLTGLQCQTHEDLTAFRYLAMCWPAQKCCFKDSKAAGAGVRPAALPCPPYAPLSWAAIVGRRTGGEEMLVMRPLRLSSPPLLLRWKGTPSPTQKQWITRNGFYAAKFWYPQKRKPRRPYIEALSAVALLHSPGGGEVGRITCRRLHHRPMPTVCRRAGKSVVLHALHFFTARQSRKSGNAARLFGEKPRRF
jgi:hypothetical protein